MNAVAKVLNAAADLLEPEGAWTQGATARDRRYWTTFSSSPEAVCWCATGAITRLTIDNHDLYYRAVQRLRLANGLSAIANWNDTPGRTQAEVVAAFRKAAKEAADES